MLLDRPGTFKALPMSWDIATSEASKSVALVIQFKVLEFLTTKGWEDWRGFADQEITGYFYIVKKDGTPNTVQIDALYRAIGWNGDISLQTLRREPAETPCQIVVEIENYNGKEKLKVKWINPEDFTPGIRQSDDATVQDVNKVYASQLRAAAAAAAKAAGPAKPAASPPPAAKKRPDFAPAPAPAGAPEADDDLPF